MIREFLHRVCNEDHGQVIGTWDLTRADPLGDRLSRSEQIGLDEVVDQVVDWCGRLQDSDTSKVLRFFKRLACVGRLSICHPELHTRR